MTVSPQRLCQSAGDALLRRPLRTVLCMIVFACGLVASTWHVFGLTWDEPEHVAAGMQLLDKDQFIYDLQHPPVARLAMALGPWLAGAHAYDEPGPSGEQSGRDLFYTSGHYQQYLDLARLGMLPFYALMLLSVWLWARHFYGETQALLATALLIATPPLMGHAGVAALDIPGTATCTLALYFLLRWYETQSWRHVWFTGLASGVAIASKLSSLPFIAVVGATWLPFWWLSRNASTTDDANTQRHIKPARRFDQWLGQWFGQSLSIVLIALTLTIFTYSLRFRYTVTDAQPVNEAWDFLFSSSGFMHDAMYAVARSVPLPVGLERFALSLQALLMHNQWGHTSYLLGRFSETGFREFYVVGLLVKTPIPLLLLGIGGLIYLTRQALKSDWKMAAPVLAFVSVLVFCSFYSHINIGLRHVFVLYPLWCIAAAAFCVHLWHHAADITAKPIMLRGALLFLTGWQFTMVATQHPDYLPYFNAFAGQHPEKILIDSDLDWGQDVRRLQQRLAQLKIDQIAFIYRGTADVLGERLPGVTMTQPSQRPTGWVAASVFARDTTDSGKAYAWLRDYTPRERIGKSIYLYYIPDSASTAHAQ